MPRAGSAGWWAAKVRQARAFGRAAITAEELAKLNGWLSQPQLRVFEAMHVADQRHGLDVVAWLREHGESDPEVLLAGLLHDAGKGDTGFWPRVVHALAQAYGARIEAVPAVLPGWRADLARLRDHAELSAALAEETGASALTVELIRHQDDPPADETARRFHLADEAN